MEKRLALISVSNKEGIVQFARGLVQCGYSIISSGGTAKTLREGDVPSVEISEYTGFPEILGGRVKTLQPKIHGGILARRGMSSDMQELAKRGIVPIDIVVANLYPFEETLGKRKGAEAEEKAITEDIIENIDIGGVALLRAAAKNFHDVLVVCDPNDYQSLLENLEKDEVPMEFRRGLAAKAFRHTAYYDGLIAGYFSLDKFPERVTIPLKKISSLRYGENPHQEAALYRLAETLNESLVVNARQMQGKELSYNNYLDLEAAWNLVQEFEEPACAIIKHNNPCGCAQAESILQAYERALLCDPASAYGGIVAFNRPIDDATAAEVVKLFTECIIAPACSAEAAAIVSSKKNLRLLIMPQATAGTKSHFSMEYRAMRGGMLVQDRDNELLRETIPVTSRPPSDIETVSLLFAWKIAKHVKSNAIVLARGQQTVGIGAGQMSRIDSLNIASEKMKAVKLDPDAAKPPLVLASDAFFPFADVVNGSALIGVTAIIQPGGSMRDEDSIRAANDHGMAMVFTAMRHFKH